jgi:multicomponent Na+:H+ antiporter subunit F
MSEPTMTAMLDPTNVAYAMIVIAMFLGLIRLVLGPTLPDRVVALDLITVLAAAMLALDTLATRQAVFIVRALLTVIFFFLTAPVAAHMIARAAYFTTYRSGKARSPMS